MKKIVFVFLLVSSFAFSQKKNWDENLEKKNVAQTLDRLNAFAAKAAFVSYFDLFAEESTFIGTDATEIWNKKEFMEYAKPHFDKGKTWNFTSLKRHISFSKDGKYAWFDELLDTQMKICRGSGVLEKIGKDWKIKQYVLSITIPNEAIKEVIEAKTPIEDKLLNTLNQEKQNNLK